MKEMAVFKTADLSILRLPVQTIEQSSFISILNWSRLFFSLRFRDFLDARKIIHKKLYRKFETLKLNTLYLLITPFSSISYSVSWQSLLSKNMFSISLL